MALSVVGHEVDLDLVLLFFGGLEKEEKQNKQKIWEKTWTNQTKQNGFKKGLLPFNDLEKPKDQEDGMMMSHECGFVTKNKPFTVDQFLIFKLWTTKQKSNDQKTHDK